MATVGANNLKSRSAVKVSSEKSVSARAYLQPNPSNVTATKRGRGRGRLGLSSLSLRTNVRAQAVVEGAEVVRQISEANPSDVHQLLETASVADITNAPEITATLLAQVAAAGGLIGSGNWLDKSGVVKEEMEAMENEGSDDGEVDIYRDTPLRYLGYSNEVGEAFRPIFGDLFTTLTYVVACSYVAADARHKYYKQMKAGSEQNDIDWCYASWDTDEDDKKPPQEDGWLAKRMKIEPVTPEKAAMYTGLDALLWQLTASVILPGFTINRIVTLTSGITEPWIAPPLESIGVPGALAHAIPTVVGLAVIPTIVRPLDVLTEVAFDVSVRKIIGYPINQCEAVMDEDPASSNGNGAPAASKSAAKDKQMKL